MNYLAHLALSETDGMSLIGSLLPDLSCGPVQEDWPEEIISSYERHLAVDRFTDKDSKLKSLNQSLCKESPRHSSILIDIAFDHFLALHWDLWYHPSLKKFTALVYSEIDKNKSFVPQRCLPFFNNLLDKRWLTGYRHKEGVYYSLLSVSRRLRSPNQFVECYDEFLDNYKRIEEVFLEFYPRLRDAVSPKSVKRFNLPG